MTAGLLAFGGLGSQAVCRTRQERSPQLSHMSERTSQRRLFRESAIYPGVNDLGFDVYAGRTLTDASVRGRAVPGRVSLGGESYVLRRRTASRDGSGASASAPGPGLSGDR